MVDAGVDTRPFLLDEHVPRVLASTLRSNGYCVERAAEQFGEGTVDEELLAWCGDDGPLPFTNDRKDFGSVDEQHAGVFVYVDQNWPRDRPGQVVAVIDEVLRQYPANTIGGRTVWMDDWIRVIRTSGRHRLARTSILPRSSGFPHRSSAVATTSVPPTRRDVRRVRPEAFQHPIPIDCRRVRSELLRDRSAIGPVLEPISVEQGSHSDAGAREGRPASQESLSRTPGNCWSRRSRTARGCASRNAAG